MCCKFIVHFQCGTLVLYINMKPQPAVINRYIILFPNQGVSVEEGCVSAGGVVCFYPGEVVRRLKQVYICQGTMLCM